MDYKWFRDSEHLPLPLKSHLCIKDGWVQLLTDGTSFHQSNFTPREAITASLFWFLLSSVFSSSSSSSESTPPRPSPSPLPTWLQAFLADWLCALSAAAPGGLPYAATQGPQVTFVNSRSRENSTPRHPYISHQDQEKPLMQHLACLHCKHTQGHTTVFLTWCRQGARPTPSAKDGTAIPQRCDKHRERMLMPMGLA